GHVLDEHVPAREEGDEELLHHFALPDEDALDVLAQRLDLVGVLGHWASDGYAGHSSSKSYPVHSKVISSEMAMARALCVSAPTLTRSTPVPAIARAVSSLTPPDASRIGRSMPAASQSLRTSATRSRSSS